MFWEILLVAISLVFSERQRQKEPRAQLSIRNSFRFTSVKEPTKAMKGVLYVMLHSLYRSIRGKAQCVCVQPHAHTHKPAKTIHSIQSITQ